jgi:large subunit ribosomal protein L21
VEFEMAKNENIVEPYAVVATGGKQYRVKKDDVLNVERLDTDAGKSITLEVLAVSDGTTLTVGTPTVKGAKVKSTVVEHIRGEKTISFKKKRRKGYARTKGHRQELTVLKVDSIG